MNVEKVGQSQIVEDFECWTTEFLFLEALHSQ